MAGYEEQAAVQLEGEELERLRKAMRDVDEAVHASAEVADRALGKDAASTVRLVIFLPGNEKQIHSDGDNCLYVMENPPGITRPCTEEESSSCHEVAKLLKR
jgi:hypothetical protein